jgi:hypothetical protein
MKFFDIVAVLIVISALFAYINFRFIKLPSVIGVMLVSILVSIGMILADLLGLGIAREGEYLLKNIDFKNTLMVWMLGFLLFAGALNVELNALHEQKWNVLVFSTVGVIFSTVYVERRAQNHDVGRIAWGNCGSPCPVLALRPRKESDPDYDIYHGRLLNHRPEPNYEIRCYMGCSEHNPI